MKTRRVVLTIEAETDVPLSTLRNRERVTLLVHPADSVRCCESISPVQVQANVIRAADPAKRAKRARS